MKESQYTKYHDELVTLIEKSETWLEGLPPNIHSELDKWASDFEAACPLAYISEHEADVILLLTYVRLGQKLKILKKINQARNGVPGKLLEIAAQKAVISPASKTIDPEALICRRYCDRFMKIFSCHMVNRIFDKERRQRVKTALSYIR
jgi:hypothetical protein